MKTIVMTGATSFLGRNLLRELLNRGYFVYALVRSSSPDLQLLPKSEHLKLLYGSLEDLNTITQNIQAADWLIHFAWDGSGSQGRADRVVQQRNITYAMQALQIAERLGCEAFLFPGSQAEYGKVSGMIEESMECHPLSEYGRAKLEFSQRAELFCQKNTVRLLHMRIFSVYGIGDRPGTLVDECVRKLNHGQEVILGPCQQKWNYLYIDDFVRMALTLLENSEAEGIYNIASRDTRILREFVYEIFECSNRSGCFKFTDIVGNPEGSPDLNPNVDKIMTFMGQTPLTPFRIGIENIMKADIKGREE